jgi:hypothetical protein
MTQEAAMDSGQMQGLVDNHMTAEKSRRHRRRG